MLQIKNKYQLCLFFLLNNSVAASAFQQRLSENVCNYSRIKCTVSISVSVMSECLLNLQLWHQTQCSCFLVGITVKSPTLSSESSLPSNLSKLFFKKLLEAVMAVIWNLKTLGPNQKCY